MGLRLLYYSTLHEDVQQNSLYNVQLVPGHKGKVTLIHKIPM